MTSVIKNTRRLFILHYFLSHFFFCVFDTLPKILAHTRSVLHFYCVNNYWIFNINKPSCRDYPLIIRYAFISRFQKIICDDDHPHRDDRQYCNTFVHHYNRHVYSNIIMILYCSKYPRYHYILYFIGVNARNSCIHTKLPIFYRYGTVCSPRVGVYYYRETYNNNNIKYIILLL